MYYSDGKQITTDEWLFVIVPITTTKGPNANALDSGRATTLIDSSYIQHRTRIGLNDIDFGSNIFHVPPRVRAAMVHNAIILWSFK